MENVLHSLFRVTCSVFRSQERSLFSCDYGLFSHDYTVYFYKFRQEEILENDEQINCDFGLFSHDHTLYLLKFPVQILLIGGLVLIVPALPIVRGGANNAKHAYRGGGANSA